MKYFRFKGRWKTGDKKIVIAEMIGGKEKHHKTVPRAEHLFDILSEYGNMLKPSQEKEYKNLIDDEKFGQELLDEPYDVFKNKTEAQREIDKLF